MACSKVRVIYKDKKTDFAVVKADFQTPRFFRLGNSSLDGDEVFFAGKWTALTITAGRLIRSEDLLSTYNGMQITLKESVVTNPIQAGDSGAPLINSKGELCGVMSRTRVGRWKKKKEAESYAIMMDHAALNEIIRRDRKNQVRQAAMTMLLPLSRWMHNKA